MKKFAEIIFLLYFISHIFITVLFDSQLVLPTWIYPVAVNFKFCFFVVMLKIIF